MMLRAVLCAVCLLSAGILTFAAPVKDETGPPTAGQFAAGQDLAEHVRSALPEESTELHGRLIIRCNGAQKEIPITCRVTVNATGWKSDYETAATDQAPAEHLVVIHHLDAANEYLYARAASVSGILPRPGAMPPAQACSTALAGSDFSLADLGLDFLHWPKQWLVKNEMRLGEPCYLLESSDPPGGEVVRVRSDIDKEFNAPLIAVGYDAGGGVVKEFSLHGSSFKKVNGRWQLEKMDIRNKKTGSHTELKFDLTE
jgi:hypothetical protein